jgi:hypothetical protein
MPSISVPAAVIGAGAIGAAGGLASGVIGSNAATSAAKTQATAAESGQQIQAGEFQQIEDLLSPYSMFGAGAVSSLAPLIGTQPGGNPLTAPLTAPFQPTQAQLASTPGYQFTLQQGEQAVTNSAAAQGLASSGAALKGAANYAEGLAGTTYQQQFQNYLAQNQQIYNLLAGAGTLGENAAATTGAQGSAITSNITNLLTGGAAAAAAGQVGSANAITSGIGNITGAGGNTALLLALNNSGLFGGQNTGGLT